MANLKRAICFTIGIACVNILFFILLLHSGQKKGLLEFVFQHQYSYDDDKDSLEAGLKEIKDLPIPGVSDNKDIPNHGVNENKDPLNNVHGQSTKLPFIPTKSVITSMTNSTNSSSLQPGQIQQHIHYNRTTILQYDKNIQNVPSTKIITYGEGCDRQFDKFNALYPKANHIKNLLNKDIKRTWNRIRKLRFEIHKPVIVSREHIIPALNNSPPMPLYTLQIQLEETLSGKASRGGSAFRVISVSAYHVLCGFSDLFNGSYYFFCPVYGNNATVSIQLSHIDFQGYTGMTSSWDEYIWQESVTIEDNSPVGTLIRPWTRSEYHQKFASPHGLWTSGNRPLYHTNTGHVLIKHKNLMCDCMKRFTLVMLGSSHIRNAHYCLFHLCQHRRLIYKMANYMHEVWNRTDTIVQKFNQTADRGKKSMARNPVFIVQAGSWDLNFKDFKNTTLNVLPAFMANLSSLRERGARIIVIGTPSLPNEGTPPYKRVARNNAITAVFDKRQSELAQKYGLEFIDMFSVTMPRYRMRPLEHGRPTHHYVVEKCQGLVGVTTFQILFEKLCPDLVKDYGMWTDKIEEAYKDERVRQKYMSDRNRA